MHEQGVVGPFADHADLDLVFRIPAGEGIDAVQAGACVEIVDGAFAVDLEREFVQREVDRTPPDIIFRGGMADDSLVFGRASGFLARVGNQRSHVRDTGAGFVPDGLFVEGGRRGVLKNVADSDSVG